MQTFLAVIGCLVGMVLLAPGSHAQEFKWAVGIGGGGSWVMPTGVAVDANGNVITAGYFNGTTDFDPDPTATYELTAYEDPYVCKLDKDGHFMWAARFAGGGEGDTARGVAVDSEGNVYTTGQFYYTMDFDPGPGTAYLISRGWSDAFVSKLDSAGNHVSAKQLAIRPTDYETGTAIATDASDNVYVAAENGTPDLNIYKFAPAGTLLLRTVVGAYSAQGIAADANGNVITAGWSYTAGGSGFVSKLDGSGLVVWTKLLGAAARGVGVDSAGNVYATGDFYGTVDFDPGPGVHNLVAAGDSDIFILKLDNAGNFVWTGQLSGTGSEHSLGIALDANGKVVVTGSFTGTVDFDPSGGVFPMTTYTGQRDGFVCKLANSGALVWAAQLRSTAGSSSQAKVVATRPDLSLNVVGLFSGTVDFDPGASEILLTSHGLGSDTFVAKYLDNLCIDVDANGSSDNDGDGLCDNWETAGRGVDWDQDGTIDLDLWNYDVNKDGTVTADERPNIDVKDVYVEIDWMERHEPSWDEIRKVISSFAQAGCDDLPPAPCAANGGIRLHVQKDEQVLSHATNVGWSSFDIPPNAGEGDFNDIKSLEFGTDTERSNPAKRAAKALTFHYGLFAHKLSNKSWKGLGEGGSIGAGNDFIVTLGAWWPFDNFPGKRVSETFMHELGHNLGLLHGGGDGASCKPNYLSVMNLMFAEEGEYVDSRPLDYSRKTLLTLNETALDERVGIGGAAGRLTAHGPPHCLGFPDTLCSYDSECWPLWCVNYTSVDASSAIDWNANGDIDTDVLVRDINYLKGNDGCGESVPSASSPLTSFNDWKNVRFDFKSNCFWTDTCYGSNVLSMLSGPALPEERTYEEVLEGTDTDKDGISNLLDTCPYSANPGQENLDDDPYGDACDCAPADPGTYPEAVEINDGMDNQCPGEIGYGLVDEIDALNIAAAELWWFPQDRASEYEIARAAVPTFSPCTLQRIPGTSYLDPETPLPGVIFYYLVCAAAPNPGSWGASSLGVERTLACE